MARNFMQVHADVKFLDLNVKDTIFYLPPLWSLSWYYFIFLIRFVVYFVLFRTNFQMSDDVRQSEAGSCSRRIWLSTAGCFIAMETNLKKDVEQSLRRNRGSNDSRRAFTKSLDFERLASVNLPDSPILLQFDSW
jgi:hypothetical protein